MPALLLWLTESLWDQFSALLPVHRSATQTAPALPPPAYQRRIMFDKLLQLLQLLVVCWCLAVVSA